MATVESARVSIAVGETENWQSELHHHFACLRDNQLPSSLWVAVPGITPQGKKIPTWEIYTHFIWLRDNVFITDAFLETGEKEITQKAIGGILAILKKHEHRLDEIIADPSLAHEGNGGNLYRLCPRYDQNLDEQRPDWNNFQNDNPGEVLFILGKAQKLGLNFLEGEENEANRQICQRLVEYLEKIQYWRDPDAGFWEEPPLLMRASSVGACVAGLKAVEPYLEVSPALIEKGEETLARLLPQEAEGRLYDAALLYLIYPFEVVNLEMAQIILQQTEEYLFQLPRSSEEKGGCLRYLGDGYNAEGEQPALWPMLVSQAALGYLAIGNFQRARELLEIARNLKHDGRFPEAWRGETPLNGPLFWAEATYVTAVTRYLRLVTSLTRKTQSRASLE